MLKDKLTNKQTQTETHAHPYFKVKELIVANQEEEQLCSLCNHELGSGVAINIIKLYFCDNNNCSLLMEKIIDTIITTFRKK